MVRELYTFITTSMASFYSVGYDRIVSELDAQMVSSVNCTWVASETHTVQNAIDASVSVSVDATTHSDTLAFLSYALERRIEASEPDASATSIRTENQKETQKQQSCSSQGDDEGVVVDRGQVRLHSK